MTWVAWRQFRASAVVAVAALAVAAILLELTWHPIGGNSERFVGLSHVHLLKYLSTVLVAVPALIGAFWGAPLLAHELEAGTHRLAWTQSITRTRWLATKVAVIGLASVAVTGVFSLMLTGWSSHAVNLGRLAPAMFDERGIAPIGDAVFALALGVAAGVLIRRTLPAMAVTLVGFIAVRMIVTNWVRPHFAAPLKQIASFQSAQAGAGFVVPKAGAWTVSTYAINPAGRRVSSTFGCRSFVVGHKVGQGPDPAALRAAKAAAHACNASARAYVGSLRQVITYQPLSRYWTFQAYDVALFVGLAVILLGFSFWWVRTRVA